MKYKQHFQSKVSFNKIIRGKVKKTTTEIMLNSIYKILKLTVLMRKLMSKLQSHSIKIQYY